MRSQRHLIDFGILVLSVLLLPLVGFARDQQPRGTPSPPRGGGAAESSEPRAGGQRRPLRQSEMKVLQLPAPSMSGALNVEAALSRLQSLTAPSDQQLKLSEIGQLAWAAQGRLASATVSGASVTDERALVKVHFVLPDGLYVYVPPSHSLQQTGEGDLRASLSAGLLSQQNAPVGGCQIVVSGSSKDFSSRYGNKARNIMSLLAGQMVQSIQLQALALNLTFVGINNVDINTARRICRLTRESEPLYVLLVGYPATAVAAPSQTPPPGGSKKVVIVTPQSGFQDEELFETKRGLEFNSVQVLVASMRVGPVRSMLDRVIGADLTVGQVKAADFDAIVFVGGIGTTELVNNRIVWDLVHQAAAQRKIMAASGNAPAILAAANVLSGARLTGALEIRDRLTAAGAVYTGRTVEKDGPLVTSMGPGPQIVPVFVRAILDALAGQ